VSILPSSNTQNSHTCTNSPPQSHLYRQHLPTLNLLKQVQPRYKSATCTNNHSPHAAIPPIARHNRCNPTPRLPPRPQRAIRPATIPPATAIPPAIPPAATVASSHARTAAVASAAAGTTVRDAAESVRWACGRRSTRHAAAAAVRPRVPERNTDSESGTWTGACGLSGVWAEEHDELCV
jgi:hypothetical protein